MKKAFSGLLAVALVLSMMWCGAAMAEGNTWVMAINATFPPFESIDGETTEFVGIDIDMAKVIAEKLGITLDIQDMQFSALVPTMQSGRADVIISGISPTAERLEILDFTIPYYFPMNAIICKKDGGYNSLDTLKGKKIGVSLGTSYAQVAASVEGAEVSELDSTPLVIQEILNGRCDAGIFDATQAVEFVKQNEGLEMHTIPSEISMDDTFAIALPKGSEYTEKINDILREILADGTFRAILVNHIGEEATAQYEESIKDLEIAK